MNIQEIFKKFEGKKILVAGDVMLDAYLWGKTERISPEAPVPVVNIEKTEARPGGAANVALNLKEMGAVPLLFSVIGNDAAANSLIKILKQKKINTSGLLLSASRITTVKTRVISKNHQLIRFDSEQTDYPDEATEKKFISALSRAIKKEKPAAVIFEDYNKGVLTEKVISTAIALCRAMKIFTAVDPKKHNFFVYKNANLFKPNLSEIREALNLPQQNVSLKLLSAAAEKLQKLIPHQFTLITLSEDGIFYKSRKSAEIIAVQKRNVADVSGAGDTVIAIATLCLVSGLSLRESAILSNLSGGLVCQYAGVVPVTKKMLADALIG